MHNWFAVLAVSLFSVLVFAHSNYEALSGEEKEKLLFSQIEKSAYGEKISPMASPSTWDKLSLFSANYDAKAFSNSGDIMAEGRSKLIHGSGTTALIFFHSISNHPYTGLLSAGAPHGILRISLAVASSDDAEAKLIPGLAMKFFIDGKPSVNIMAMPSLDGQKERNIFEHTYTTNLAKPSFSVSGWLLENRFASSLSYVGQKNGNPRSFSIEELAEQTSMGEEVASPLAPFSLEFKPTTFLNSLGQNASLIDKDFRKGLDGLGGYIALFEVYARASELEEPELIGFVCSRSNFIASSFGDEKLFFKHPRVHEPDPEPRDEF